uniref:Uncharacterized protein n=1 Tax=Fusarium oxysporum (strain Fo5176) TaxID=660025 RepID=A0A0D2Y3G8_FUSOF
MGNFLDERWGCDLGNSSTGSHDGPPLRYFSIRVYCKGIYEAANQDKKRSQGQGKPPSPQDWASGVIEEFPPCGDGLEAIEKACIVWILCYKHDWGVDPYSMHGKLGRWEAGRRKKYQIDSTIVKSRNAHLLH